MHLLDGPEARRHEHAAVGQPIEEARLPPFLVAPHLRSEARIEWRNAVEDQSAVDPVGGDGERLRVRRRPQTSSNVASAGTRAARRERKNWVMC